MENATATPPVSRLPRRLAISIALAVALLATLYAVGGFVLLPWYAQRELPQIVAEKLQRKAHVDEIRFNPFTLTLEAKNFSLKEHDGRPLVSFKHALIDLEWRALLHRAVVFGEIRLDTPSLHVEIAPDGRLNLAALAGEPAHEKPADAKLQETKAAPLPRFAIHELHIEHGVIAFDDQRAGYKNIFEDLAIKLSSLSTYDDAKGPYDLSARTPGGATLKWKGEASIAPLAATGTLAFEHSALSELQPFVKDFVNAAITDGRLTVELPYRFAMHGGKPSLEIHGGKLGVESFALTASGAAAPAVKLAALAVDDIAIDLAARSIGIGAITISAPELKAQRDENGAIDLAALAVPRAPDAAAAPWQIAIANVALNGGSVAFDDRVSGLAPALKDIAVKLSDVSGDFSKAVPFELSASIVSGGTLNGSGRIAQGGAVDAKISGVAIALAPLQPLLARFANAALNAGEAAFSGTLKTGQKNAALVYAGSASINNVQINDQTGVPLLGWKSLATTTLRAQVAPTQVHIDAIHWQEPAGKYAIAADQTSNFRRAIKPKDNTAATPAATANAPAAALPANTPVAATPDSADDDDDDGVAVQIRRIDIKQGALDFSDDSLGGGFSTSIHEFNGTINGISSDRGTRSQLALEGRVDEFGYAKVTGSLNPFLPRDRSTARFEFRNLDVAKVTPYAVRFAGYKIASGRMSLDLNYRVVNNLIQGDNRILLEQFTLGEKVESPGAMNLPLELAIALLKDSDGKIDLALPVTGNLDDPKFDYSEIIGKAIGNLISGIFAAPFKLLAALFSGVNHEEFSNIGFDPGSARLLPPEREKLNKIVQALAKRPELKLMVPARYDVELDARALKRAALRLELGKRAGLDIEVEDPPGPLNIDDRRTRSAVRELFAERFSRDELDKVRSEAEAKAHAADGGKSQQAMSSLERLGRFASGEPHVADTGDFYRALGGRLVNSQPLAADALADLARKRAAVIGEALKAAGIDMARVALTNGDPLNNPEAKNVALELALSAR